MTIHEIEPKSFGERVKGLIGGNMSISFWCTVGKMVIRRTIDVSSKVRRVAGYTRSMHL